MTRSELAKLEKDLDVLFEKHKNHPAIIFFKPPNSKQIMVLFLGNPSNEWIAKAGQYQMKRFEQFIMTRPSLAPVLGSN